MSVKHDEDAAKTNPRENQPVKHTVLQKNITSEHHRLLPQFLMLIFATALLLGKKNLEKKPYPQITLKKSGNAAKWCLYLHRMKTYYLKYDAV